MAFVSILQHQADVDLIVFDKDGTLVAFDALWAGKLRRAVAAVVDASPFGESLAAPLFRSLGLDAATGQVVPESPLAVASVPTLGLACALVLSQAGHGWSDAVALSRHHFMPKVEAPPTRAELVPLADLPALMAPLAEAGIGLAICTSDDRRASEASLALLGLEGLIEALVCGDDDIANKPAPDGLLHLAARFGVRPERVMMVGDSVVDLRTGRAAGAGCCVGVLSGTGVEAEMTPHADVIAPDISAIGIA